MHKALDLVKPGAELTALFDERAVPSMSGGGIFSIAKTEESWYSGNWNRLGHPRAWEETTRGGYEELHGLGTPLIPECIATTRGAS